MSRLGLAPGRVVVAPDKFTGSLTAAQAAAALSAGVRDALPGVEVVQRPVADGGDGTLDALVTAGWSTRAIDVLGPTGEPVHARIARHGDTAAVELADCCGRLRLPAGRTAPMTASTHGLGTAIRCALEDGVATVLIGVGGSASTDGGLGLLDALGVRVLDTAGRAISTAIELAGADRIDDSGLVADLTGTRLVLATDVQSPLLGASGAARQFGPQKGATPLQTAELEAAMTRWALVLARHRGHDVATIAGAGAAGGVVAGVLGALGTRGSVEVISGADAVLDAIGLDDDLSRADAVIVGEGALDGQSLLGKAPVAVARRALAHGCRVLAVAGRIGLDPADLRAAGIVMAIALTDIARDGEDPMRDAAVLARRAAAQAVRSTDRQ